MDWNRFAAHSFKMLVSLAFLSLLMYSKLKKIEKVAVSTPYSGFVGDEFWSDDEMKLCNDVEEDTTWIFGDSLCFVVRRGFEETRIEIFSWAPPVVVFRGMYSKKEVADYLRMFKNQTLTPEMVLGEDNEDVMSPYRRSNGTITPTRRFPEAQKLIQTASRLIPALDFKISEDMLGMSYREGGHFAPHYDYLDPEETTEDTRWRILDNMMATTIVTIKSAEIGGGTLFSFLGTNVKTAPGDVLLWMNAKENKEKELLVLNAECPVYSGEKITATVWLRTAGQAIFHDVYKNNSIDANFLLR